MAILAVIAQQPKSPATLGMAIAQNYPNNYLQIDGDAWLIAAKSSPQELCDKLGITNGQNGSAVVVTVGAYFGRANPNIWAWIKERWEAAGG